MNQLIKNDAKNKAKRLKETTFAIAKLEARQYMGSNRKIKYWKN